MPPFLKFGLGCLARLLGMVAEQWAQWLFHQVSTGAESGLDLLAESWQFCQWFLRMLAGQFSGRSRPQYDDYGEEMRPGLFPG
jgi:hypothetical protein